MPWPEKSCILCLKVMTHDVERCLIAQHLHDEGVCNLSFPEAKIRFICAKYLSYKHACAIRLGALAEENHMVRSWLVGYLSLDRAKKLDPPCLSQLLHPFKINSSPLEIAMLYRFYIGYDGSWDEDKLGVVAHLSEIFGLWENYLTLKQKTAIVLRIDEIRYDLANWQPPPDISIKLNDTINKLRHSVRKQADELAT